MHKRKREDGSTEYSKLRNAPINHEFTRQASQESDNVCSRCHGYPMTYGPCEPGFQSKNVNAIRCCCQMQQFLFDVLKL